jgi:hypothetical protein
MLDGVNYLSPEWIWIISFYGWSSYVISFGLRHYLSFVLYFIQRLPKYPGWRGESLFQICYFSVDVLSSIRIHISRQIHYGSFLLFLTLCVLLLSLSHVTVGHFESFSNFHFWKQKIQVRRSLFPNQCFVVSSLCSHNFSFFIQFTSNRLVLYNSHHIIWVDWFPLLLILYYFV